MYAGYQTGAGWYWLYTVCSDDGTPAAQLNTKHLCYVYKIFKPNICEILLKMFINIKTFGLKIITIMFLIIFVLLF